MKVLIGAYACEPGQGSEPAVGWHWSLEAAKAGHEVWVITRANNRPAIEAAMPQLEGRIPHFEYVDLPRPFLWCKRRFGHPGQMVYCYLWQVALAAKAWRLHRVVHFDLTHHVTFVNDTLPSGLCLLPTPFIWGPVGGSTHQLPPEIDMQLPAYARRHETVRAAFQSALQKLDPFLAFTRRRANLVLVYTKEAISGLPPACRRKARTVVHIGIAPEDVPSDRQSARPSSGVDLEILAGGRLVHWKGFDLLIEGLAEFLRENPATTARLRLTGTGRFQPELAKLARRLGIPDSVEFLGHLPTRADVFRLMRDCDLYALPTLRDGPPVALLEAMACGVPVLCLDLGAPGELVPDGRGIKIAPTSRESIIRDISRACRWIVGNRPEAAAMGAAAGQYALREHDWGCIGIEIERAYAEFDARPPAS